MAKRNTLKLDLSGFEELLTELDKLGGDLKSVVTDALTQAGETIADDTIDAMADKNLPANAKYSTGKTKESIIRNSKVEWEGLTASIGVGFDYSKEGAGGLLITGTPRMKPNAALKKIYKTKKYMKGIQTDLIDIVTDAITDKLGG